VGTASASPPRLRDRLGRLGARVGLAARDHHARAREREALRDRAADPAAAAGDDRDAAIEAEQVIQLVLFHSRFSSCRARPPDADPAVTRLGGGSVDEGAIASLSRATDLALSRERARLP
jgi:hypothetical protein